MKKAKCSVVTFEVLCPHCKEAVVEPRTGSYQWQNRTQDVQPGTVYECDQCGKKFQLPKRVADNLI